MSALSPAYASLPLRTTLPDGTPIIIRPVTVDDRQLFTPGLQKLSVETRRQRFLQDRRDFSSDELNYLSACDGINHLAICVAIVDAGGVELEPIAVARCIRYEQGGSRAEVSIVVTDEVQGQGLGTLLFKTLAECALRVGIRTWEAHLSYDNGAAHRLMELVGNKTAQQAYGPGVVLVTYQLRRGDDLEDTPLPQQCTVATSRVISAQRIVLLAFSFSLILILLVKYQYRNRPHCRCDKSNP